ncbi:MAG: hypothetical protein QG550_2528 [Pseudomonadota bacterium]|jgi:hypothetical protein|nr:hypothetical protein [Pseudomonadota bacterium]
MNLELPPRLLADRLSVLLILGCGAVLEAALWRHPGLPGGAGIVTAGLLLAWHLRRARAVPTQAVWGPHGWRLLLADGRRIDANLGRGTRLLGPSVVLHWRAEGRSYRAWLTAADVPRPLLRSLAVRLLAQARVVGP